MAKFVLGLDQGTTSSRAIVFGHDGRAVGSAQQEFEQLLPRPGHVEHDPEAIWESQLAVAKQALAAAGVSAADLAAVGVTNQRETTILWERDTGKPVANAMVWQSRASAGAGLRRTEFNFRGPCTSQVESPVPAKIEFCTSEPFHA